ncbi:MAG: ECF transporter S component, partial [Raoultibacter sp.]
FIVPAALVYRRVHNYKGAGAGLIISIIVATLGAIAANLTIGVAFWYGTPDAVLPLILPALVPFNLVKGALNAALTLVVYKAISNLITPKKAQIKGK